MKAKFFELFEKVTTYCQISEEEWVSLADHATRRDVNAGDYLDKAGTVSGEFFYVEKGLFRSFYHNANGDEYIKSFTLEGQLLGSFTSLLTKSPSELTIQALEPSTVLAFDYQNFKELSKRYPSLETGARLVAEHIFIESERKERQLLIYNAAERYEFFLKNYSYLQKRIHQYMIAMYLGITPVSLSRIINGRSKSPKA